MANITEDVLTMASGLLQDPTIGIKLGNDSADIKPKRPKRPRGGDVCYICDTPCIFKACEIVLIIGIIANILVVSRVLFDKKLRKPTFVAVACLALCDAIFVSVDVSLAIELVYKSLAECPRILSKLKTPYFDLVSGTAWFAANGHLTLLAVVRFVLIVYPLKGHLYLTTKKVVTSSVCIWIVSGIVFIGRFIDNTVNTKEKADTADRLAIFWIVAYLLPGLSTCILHLIKLRIVQRVTRHKANGQGQRMATVILLVIFCAFLFPLPKFIYQTMRLSGYRFSSDNAAKMFHNVGVLLFHFNNTLNPFIYAVFSESFRISIQNMCKFRRNRDRSSAYTTGK